MMLPLGALNFLPDTSCFSSKGKQPIVVWLTQFSLTHVQKGGLNQYSFHQKKNFISFNNFLTMLSFRPS
jgi:hypothetical protein